jgi:hypothetical protein
VFSSLKASSALREKEKNPTGILSTDIIIISFLHEPFPEGSF